MSSLDIYLAKAEGHGDDLLPWRCAFCDTEHRGKPPFEYHGDPCCQDVCVDALMALDEALEQYEEIAAERDAWMFGAIIATFGLLLLAWG